MNFLSFTARRPMSSWFPNPRPLTNLKKAFEKYPITFITGVNTLVQWAPNETWFATMPKPASQDFGVAGGMALQAAVAERWQRIAGGPLGEGYGLTETSPVV